LLHALSQAEFGLRRIDSSDIPETSNVAVTAQVAAANRNDAAVEQIVGRLSLEPRVSAVAWQMDWAIPEAQGAGPGFRQQAARMKAKLNSWNCGLVTRPWGLLCALIARPGNEYATKIANRDDGPGLRVSPTRDTVVLISNTNLVALTSALLGFRWKYRKTQTAFTRIGG
jgi:hypothetical protein